MYLKAILLMLFICFGNLLSSKDRKTESEDAFVPSKYWKEIKEGQKVPSGLHYRINLSTGKKEAKIIDKESDPDLKSKRFALPKDNEDLANLNEIEQKNPENDMPKTFRTLAEIKKDLLGL